MSHWDNHPAAAIQFTVWYSVVTIQCRKSVKISVTVRQSRMIQSPTGQNMLLFNEISMTLNSIRFFGAAAADLDCIVAGSIAGGTYLPFTAPIWSVVSKLNIGLFAAS